MGKQNPKQSGIKSWSWPTISGIVLLAVLATVVPKLLYLGRLAGLLGEPSPLNGNLCKHIDIGADACEDIVIDHETGIAYLACANIANRRTWWPPLDLLDKDVPDEQDPIFIHDLNTGKTQRLPMPDFDEEFRSHGVGIWVPPSSAVAVGSPSSKPLKTRANEDENSRVPTLMFINHRRDGSTVEIFEHHRPDPVSDRVKESNPIGELRHVATVRSPLFHTPNDVHPVSRRSFYLTNDHYYKSGIMRTIETYLTLPISNVVFGDEQGHVSEVARHVTYANGITGYNNDTIILVVSSTSGKLNIYDRILTDDPRRANHLSPRQIIPIDLLGDNVNVDHDTNAIYVTGTVDPIGLFKYAHDPTTTATSKTVRLDNFTIGDPSRGIPTHADPYTLLVLDGPLGTAKTVSAVDSKRGKTLIGGILGQGFLVCDIF